MDGFPSQHKDNAEKSIGLLFMRVYNKWHSQVKRQLKDVDLTHPQFVVLGSLGYLSQQKEAVKQTMLATMSGIDVMTVSQIVCTLEKKGLLERKEFPGDTRAKSVQLTAAGEVAIRAALPVVEEVDQEFFRSLGKQQTTFMSLLNTLNESSEE